MQPNFRMRSQDPVAREFEEKIVQVNRTSKKTTGGNAISFSVLVVVGDKKGRVGVGLGKAKDVSSAVQKAAGYAKHHLFHVSIVHGTIPHEIFIKWGAAKILLRPAKEGTGIIAGGAVRAVVETAGITNIVAKILGTPNKTTNVYATIEALKQLQQTSRKRQYYRSQPKPAIGEGKKIEAKGKRKER